MTRPNFFMLSRSERDHLLAAVQRQSGRWPNGMDIQRQVESIRGDERPANATTYDALETLADMGLLERKDISDKAVGWKVTHAGREVLQHAVKEFTTVEART